MGERTSTEYFPTSTNGGRKWAELGKLQSASELRKVEEAEDEPSGVDVSESWRSFPWVLEIILDRCR